MPELLFHQWLKSQREKCGTKLKWIMAVDGDYYSGLFLIGFQGIYKTWIEMVAVVSFSVLQQQWNSIMRQTVGYDTGSFLHSRDNRDNGSYVKVYAATAEN